MSPPYNPDDFNPDAGGLSSGNPNDAKAAAERYRKLQADVERQKAEGLSAVGSVPLTQGDPVLTTRKPIGTSGGIVTNTLGYTLDQRRQAAFSAVNTFLEGVARKKDPAAAEATFGPQEVEITPPEMLERDRLVQRVFPKERGTAIDVLNWMDLPANIVRSGAASWLMDAGLMRGMQEGGLSTENLRRFGIAGAVILSPAGPFYMTKPEREHVSGLDVVNGAAHKVATDKFLKWQLNSVMAQAAPELLGYSLLAGDSRDHFNVASPWGEHGVWAGALAEMFLDPTLYVGKALKGVSKLAGLAGSAAEAAGAERLARGLEGFSTFMDPAEQGFRMRELRQRQADAAVRIGANFDEIRKLDERKIFPVPPEWRVIQSDVIQPVVDKLEAKADNAARRINELTDKHEELRRTINTTRNDALNDASALPELTPTILADAKKTIGKAEKERDLIGQLRQEYSTNLTEHERLIANMQQIGEAIPEVGREVVADARAMAHQWDRLDEVPIGPPEPATLSATMAKVDAGVHPLQAFREAEDRITDLANQAWERYGAVIPHLDFRVVPFSRSSWDALRLVGDTQREWRQVSDKLLAADPMMRTDAYKRAYDIMRRNGFSADSADRMAYHAVDGMEAVTQVRALINDVRAQTKLSARPSPQALVYHSDEMRLTQAQYLNVRTQLEKQIAWATSDAAKGTEAAKKAGTYQKALEGLDKTYTEWMYGGKLGIEEKLGEMRHVADSMNQAFGSWGPMLPGTKFANGLFGPNPFLMMFRDPQRVFAGTGIWETLRGHHETYRETVDRLRGRWYAEVHEGISKEQRQLLGRALDSRLAGELAKGAKRTAEEISYANRAELVRITGDPEMGRRFDSARRIWQDMAETFGVPKENQISNYFPHLLNNDTPLARQLRSGPYRSATENVGEWSVPLDHANEIRTLRYLANGPGREYLPTSVRKRLDELTPDELMFDASEAFNIYATQMSRWKILQPALKQADETLKLFAGAGDRNYDGMAAYLGDLQSVLYGQPTRLDKQVLRAVNGFRSRVGAKPVQFSEATRASMALTMGVYRATIGLMAPTWLANLTQNIFTASEFGTLDSLKPAARIFSVNDPIEVALGLHPKPGSAEGALRGRVRAIEAATQKELRQDFEDMFRSPLGSAAPAPKTGEGKIQAALTNAKRAGRAFEVGSPREKLALARDVVDKGLFFGMEATERINRGLAFHVGLTDALRRGMNTFDAIRYGQMVAEETQFVFGALGRAPVMNSLVGRPTLGTFTSFPSKTMALMGRMAYENPTAMLRYISMSGYLSNLLSRADLDPGIVMPFGFAPSRYNMLNGMTPVARSLLAIGAMAKGNADPDSPEGIKLQQNVVKAFANVLPGLVGVPTNALHRAYDVNSFYRTGRIPRSNDFYRELPGIGHLFDLAPERLGPTAPDEIHKYVWSVAKLFGFNTNAERISRAISEEEASTRGLLRGQSVKAAAALRRKIEQDVRLRAEGKPPQPWDREDMDEVNTYVALHPEIGSADNLYDQVRRNMDTVTKAVTLTSTDKALRARMRSVVAPIAQEQPDVARALMGITEKHLDPGQP